MDDEDFLVSIITLSALESWRTAMTYAANNNSTSQPRQYVILTFIDTCVCKFGWVDAVGGKQKMIIDQCTEN